MANQEIDGKTKLITQIKASFTDRQLRQMFIQRTHEQLFQEVGSLSGPVTEQLAVEKPRGKRSKPPQSRQAFEAQVVWRGYEVLTGSPYREAEK